MENKKVLLRNVILYTYCVIQILLILASNIVRNRSEHELAALISNTNEVLITIFFIIIGVLKFKESKKLACLCFATSMLKIINLIF